MTYEKSLFINDIHVPFQNNKALKVIKNFTEYFEPNKIFILGDLIDMYAVSSFDKDPSRITDLQKDLNITKRILKQIRENNEKADIVYLEGNHTDRLRRYLWKHPELTGLDSLKIESLLNLKEYNIFFKPQTGEPIIYHNFLIEHGNIVRSQSAYTARGMFEKRGLSGISAHTHRMGAHYKTNMSGNYVWYENGCLCDLNPEYVIGKPDWLNGFSIGYFKKTSNRFNIEQIPILHNKASYGEMEF